MNNTQYKRFKERVEAIVNKKEKALREVRNAVNVKPMTIEERYKEIKSGKATLLPLEEISEYTDLFDAYVFEGNKKSVQARDKADADYNSAVAKLNDEKERLLDAAVFMNDATALNMLASFEKLEVIHG